MKTKTAMKKQGLRYFSSLTGKQKDETTNYILRVKFGLHELNEGLARAILNSYDLDEIIKVKNFIDTNIKSQKMFLHEGKFYPLNFKEIIKN